MPSSALRIHHDVIAASRDGRAVVALETAVLTHGLPRDPRDAPSCCADFSVTWNASKPANVELVLAMIAVVRANGAVPAVIGMMRGELVIGLDDAEIATLGADAQARKLSARDLAVARVQRASGGTTVAGTLKAIAIANQELEAPLRVFATGGIGGVHREWSERPDISADLPALATTPVCVVSAGAKSILDLAATLEALDTLGVVVLGLGTQWFPRFFSEGAAPLAVQREIANIDEAAAICRGHWDDLGSTTGVLLANPPPSRWALPMEDIERALTDALDVARRQGTRSADLTPLLLARLAETTGGRTIDANVAVLLNNARAAAKLARLLAS